MGEFVRGSITQLNARKHFSKEDDEHNLCRAAIQLPSISPKGKEIYWCEYSLPQFSLHKKYWSIVEICWYQF